jgi:hypothetical protein
MILLCSTEHCNKKFQLSCSQISVIRNSFKLNIQRSFLTDLLNLQLPALKMMYNSVPLAHSVQIQYQSYLPYSHLPSIIIGEISMTPNWTTFLILLQIFEMTYHPSCILRTFKKRQTNFFFLFFLKSFKFVLKCDLLSCL